MCIRQPLHTMCSRKEKYTPVFRFNIFSLNAERFFWMCICLAIIWLLFFIEMEKSVIKTTSPKTTKRNTDQHGDFLIHTPGCAISMLHPFPPNLRDVINVRKHLECQFIPELTYEDRVTNTINVNQTMAENYFPDLDHCEYIPIIKSANSSREIQVLAHRIQRFTTAIEIQDEIVGVICYDSDGKRISHKEYAFLVRNQTLDNILDSRYNKDAKRKPMNTLILGFESTSRLNFIRHMNYTYDFIMKELKAIEMYGYNKIGENTFPNAIATFLGVTMDEMNYTDYYLDEYPFIWKNFSEAGYRTFSIEDDVLISTFIYLREGFRQAPMDYYLHPLMLAIEAVNEQELCYGNRLVMEIMLDKLIDFVSLYPEDPHFSYTMISKPIHEDSDGLGPQDIHYLNMLKYLKRNNYLENTILIFLGDHGIRYGELRDTYQGSLEENLPALYIVLPEWFRKEHRDLYDNMQSNAHKLTSNFDIYATLHDVLNIGKGQPEYRYNGKYGISLFRKIPDTRTCADLKIPPNYCACASYVAADVSNYIIKHVSIFVVNNINFILRGVSDICNKLYLETVIRAQKSVELDQNVISVTEYVVTVRVQPSEGVFEASVRYDPVSKSMQLLGSISRLNKYKGQSDCVKHLQDGVLLERFCYCK